MQIGELVQHKTQQHWLGVVIKFEPGEDYEIGDYALIQWFNDRNPQWYLTTTVEVICK